MHEIKGLHQQLAELGSYPHAAMVVEAQYADFGNPAKIGRWPASHLLRVIGEIAALHPAVPLVFAGNRKLANVWTQRFFAGVAAAQHQALPAFVREPVARFDAEPADGGTDTRVRIAAMRELPDAFEFALLRGRFAEVPEPRLRRILNQLRAEGRLRCEGRGRAARWVRELALPGAFPELQLDPRSARVGSSGAVAGQEERVGRVAALGDRRGSRGGRGSPAARRARRPAPRRRPGRGRSRPRGCGSGRG